MYVNLIRCSYGLLEFEIEFHLPSKSGNTIKLCSFTLNVILFLSVFVLNVFSSKLIAFPASVVQKCKMGIHDTDLRLLCRQIPHSKVK